MDYNYRVRNAFKQGLELKNYKKLPLWLAILAFIVSLPFILLSVSAFFMFYFVYFIFKLLESPAKYLKELLHDEGKNVHNATQFIIYFIGFPFVFLMNIWLAFISSVLWVLQTLIYGALFVSTLGAIKLYFDESHERRTIKEVTVNKVLIYVCIELVFIIIYVIGIIDYEILYNDFYFYLWIFAEYIVVLFPIIYTSIAYKNIID